MESCKGPLCAFFFLSLVVVRSPAWLLTVCFKRTTQRLRPGVRFQALETGWYWKLAKQQLSFTLHLLMHLVHFFFVRFWLLSGGNSHMKRVTFRAGSKQRRHFTATNHRLHLKSFPHCNKNPGKIARENGHLPFFCFLEIKPFPQKGNRRQTIISTSWYSRYLNSQL